MSLRPLLMDASMVLAYLAGKKNQTRRIADPQPSSTHWEMIHGYELLVSRVMQCSSGKSFVRFSHSIPNHALSGANHFAAAGSCSCQQGMVGDELWVRENWWQRGEWVQKQVNSSYPLEWIGKREVYYCAENPDKPDWGWRKRPSIHMPRWASRITLPITGLRFERLQDISAADACNEGLSCITKDGSLYKYGIPDRDGLPGTDDHGWPWHEWEVDPVKAFRKLWEKIYEPGSWDKNPWVWVIDFPRSIS